MSFSCNVSLGLKNGRPYTHFAKFLHYSYDKCRKFCKILHDGKQKQSRKQFILKCFSHYNMIN